MLTWGMQVLIGLSLVLAAFSMGRMGPSFERSRFGWPLGALGLALMVFLPEPLLAYEPGYAECQRLYHCRWDLRDQYLDVLIGSLSWIVLALLGSLMIIRGSSVYGRNRPRSVTAGWVLVIAAWFLMSRMWFYEFIISEPFFILLGLIVLASMAATIWIHVQVVRYTERKTPRMPKIAPLDERESRMVTEMIRRNLGGEVE